MANTHLRSSFKGKILLVCAVLLSTVYPGAQSILIHPYLQNATPSSMVMMWETDVAGESKVNYGLTPALGQVISPTWITTPGGKILYTATLTGLNAGTRYYYKVLTGGWQSGLFDFVTPPLPASEASCRIVLMSDMQKDGGNPNIFSNLINTSLLPYLDTTYGSPLTDHLHMALLPGDVVDQGNVYAQWKNDLFNPGEALWRHIPSYPAIGNHEANSQNYFNYYNLPLNGTAGYLEHWYAHDYSNVRVLSFDTNGPYRIPAQLAWLDSMLALTCGDTAIDFVFAQMHHPFKSELWTPGETDYTGEIVERLEAFSDTCGKSTVHFFGHTHAYSRGQSRDHDHLWVNVATSGGNIDYWGEFSNQDYDEFIVSQDEYGFVMVEVTAGSQPQFVLRRLSFGDQFNPGGATQKDIVTIRKNNLAPKTPVPLFPTSNDIVSPLCFELQADGFADPDNDGHGSSHWQIATDSLNFSNPVFESWKQYANWYNDINLQALDTLTDEYVQNLQGNTAYWWRVRYRDKGLKWSNWSTATRFTTQPLTTLTGNLVINGDAEAGTGGWTATIGVIESLSPGECNGISPYAGSKYFAVGALCVEHPFASAYQEMNVASFSAWIDAGQVQALYGAYLADWANDDEPSFALLFINQNGSIIGGTDTIRYKQSAWMLKQNTVNVPSGTRTIRYIIMGKRWAGNDNDSYFDNIFCQLIAVSSPCTYYVSPGPAHSRIYVDRDATGTPDGESWVTAFRTVGDALLKNRADTTLLHVWVAEGVYPVTHTLQRDTSFVLKESVAIFGGFGGNETAVDQRDIMAHPVILTGEIGDTSTHEDNVYHVIRVILQDDTATLNGLTIESGYADMPDDHRGAGIHIDSTSGGTVALQLCTLQHCYAWEGSLIFNQGILSLTDCTLLDVYDQNPGGISIVNDGPAGLLTLDGCLILQTCADCPEIILNRNQGKVNMQNANVVNRQQP